MRSLGSQALGGETTVLVLHPKSGRTKCVLGRALLGPGVEVGNGGSGVISLLPKQRLTIKQSNDTDFKKIGTKKKNSKDNTVRFHTTKTHSHFFFLSQIEKKKNSKDTRVKDLER